MIEDDGVLERADDKSHAKEGPGREDVAESGPASADSAGTASAGAASAGERIRRLAARMPGRRGNKDADLDEDEGKKDRKPSRPFWKELPILVGVALILSMLIKTFAVQPFYIPSGSMENTLGIGDRILVNKIVYHTRDIRRGDIVVFDGAGYWSKAPEGPTSSNPVVRTLQRVGGELGFLPSGTDYIKRVIGIPGDRVQCAGNGAPILVNGRALDEASYLYPGNAPSDEPFDITVPEGRLWVMGDHRRDSADSRSHTGEPGGGTIKESTVVGRAFVVVWPLAHGRNLPIPATFKAGPQAQAAGTSTGAGGPGNAQRPDVLTPEPVGSAPVVVAGTLLVMRLRLRRRARSGSRQRSSAPGASSVDRS